MRRSLGEALLPRRHDPDLLVAIGVRVAAVRRERGLTQEDVAARAGLEPATVSRCEVGARALSLTNLLRVAEALEVGLGDLIDVQRDAPAPTLPADELEWLALWKRMPADRRQLALRTMREFARP